MKGSSGVRGFQLLRSMIEIDFKCESELLEGCAATCFVSCLYRRNHGSRYISSQPGSSWVLPPAKASKQTSQQRTSNQGSAAGFRDHFRAHRCAVCVVELKAERRTGGAGVVRDLGYRAGIRVNMGR